jgi:putative protease
MEYTLVNEKGNSLADPAKVGSHLLSPMDLNMIQHIPELAQTGVCSLKIEGRMKRPEYVATVTRIYRHALDRYRQSPEDYRVDEKDIKELAQIFNRGFTTGYFFGKPGRDMMSFKRPNNRGLRLGRVSRSDWSNGIVEIILEDDLNTGDGIEFWVTEGGRRGVVVNRIIIDGSQVEHAAAGQKVCIQAEGKIKTGDRVFKTHDALLMAAAGQSYTSPRELKKIPLGFTVRAGIGEPLKIVVTDDEGHEFSAESSFLGQEARNKPLTVETLQKQLDRLGNTPFLVGTLDANIAENVMIPASEINETRRAAIEGLAALRTAARKPAVSLPADFTGRAKKVLQIADNREITAKQVQLTVKTDKFDILNAAVQNGADVIYYGGSNLRKIQDTQLELTKALSLCQENLARLVIATPRIIRDGEIPYIRPLLEFAGDNQIGVLTANLGILLVAAEMNLPDIYADFTLNIFNSQSLLWLREKYGISQATVSPELTLGQITGLAGASEIPLEAVVEGHLPLMVTEYCPQGSLLGDFSNNSKCRRPCKASPVVGLKDRLGLVFPVAQDEFCRAHIYNTKELSMIEDIFALYHAGITRFRMETSIESPERAAQVFRYWRSELDRFKQETEVYQPKVDIKEKIAAMSPAGLTKGHYYRGVE